MDRAVETKCRPSTALCIILFFHLCLFQIFFSFRNISLHTINWRHNQISKDNISIFYSIEFKIDSFFTNICLAYILAYVSVNEKQIEQTVYVQEIQSFSTGTKKFPSPSPPKKNWEPSLKSMRQNAPRESNPVLGAPPKKNIRRYGIKLSGPGDLVPRICAAVVQESYLCLKWGSYNTVFLNLCKTAAR